MHLVVPEDDAQNHASAAEKGRPLSRGHQTVADVAQISPDNQEPRVWKHTAQGSDSVAIGRRLTSPDTCPFFLAGILHVDRPGRAFEIELFAEKFAEISLVL